jgi:5-methylcytosine-specific restriction enzyme A
VQAVSAAALSIKPRRGASLRAQVFERDGGVCALCGADTELDRKALEAMRTASNGSQSYTQAYRLLLKNLGLRAGSSLWEADHIVPLAEGGADTIDNLRTLCTYGPAGRRCHQRVTAELRARLKRRPSQVRAARRKTKRQARRSR